MRISDWSSDVCSSDLAARRLDSVGNDETGGDRRSGSRLWLSVVDERRRQLCRAGHLRAGHFHRSEAQADRKSVVEGKSVSVRVDLGGRRIIKKKKHIVLTT